MNNDIWYALSYGINPKSFSSLKLFIKFYLIFMKFRFF